MLSGRAALGKREGVDVGRWQCHRGPGHAEGTSRCRKARGGPREQRGAAAIELALVLPFLLVLVGGILQYSWYLYAMQAGTSAASDLARRISVGDCPTTAQRLALVRERLGPADAGVTPLSVVTTPSGAVEADDVGTTVEVTVTFDTADFHLPVISEFYDPTVTRTALARVEDSEPTPGGC